MMLLMPPLTGGIASRGERLDHRVIRAWSAGLMRMFGFRLRRIGTPLPGAAMFVANHVSWIDIEMLHSQRMMGFVAKREISRWPLVGWLAQRGETIFHHRGSTESLGGVLHEMLARLRDGRSVGVFPEGGTRGGREVGPFHARIFLAAVEAGVPVQPVALRYGERGAAQTHGRVPAGRELLRQLLAPARRAGARGRGAFPRADRHRPTPTAAAASPNWRASASSRRCSDATERAAMRRAHVEHADRADYRPPRWLRNPHLQSVLGSSPLRRRRGAQRWPHRRDHHQHIVDGGDGVRLQGLHSAVPGAHAARPGAAAARLGRQRRFQLHAPDRRAAAASAASRCSG